jgi:hypothetical protein
MNHRHAVTWLAVLTAALIVIPVATATRAADDVSETRNVTKFDRIRVTGAFTTTVTVGEKQLVVLSGNPDAVGRVTTEVEDGTLVVGSRPEFGFFNHSAKIEISVPALRDFANNGAGSVKIGGLAGGDLELENAGTASVVVSGVAANVDISQNGVGKIDTTALEAHDVTVSNNGVGTVRVRASGDLTMSVNGVGEIRYTGNPTHVESHVNGIGRISRL